MDREAILAEEVRDLEMLLLSLRPENFALPSDIALRSAARRCLLRTRSRPSRLSRPYLPPASAPVERLAPDFEDLIAALDVDRDQTPEARARRSQEQEPEFEFAMPPPPSLDHIPDHIRHGVPSSAGGIAPPTRPPTTVNRETANTNTRTRPRVVKYQSAHWV